MKRLLLLVVMMGMLIGVVAANAAWEGRYNFCSVTLPDNSIVVAGGGGNANNYFNDTWRSTDKGATWVQMNASSGWEARDGMACVALADNSILLMGGESAPAKKYNDTWKSTDLGATWTNLNPSAPWLARRFLSAVSLKSGNIILLGGQGDPFHFSSSIDPYQGFYNDTWISYDGGSTWSLNREHAEWNARDMFNAVVLSDDSIVLMGGSTHNLDLLDGSTMRNDVWISIDEGYSWTQQTPHANWTRRAWASAAATPDNHIVITGGYEDFQIYKHDAWESSNRGVSWSLSREYMPTEWQRVGGGMIPLSDSSVVLAGGSCGPSWCKLNDTLRSFDYGVTWSTPPWIHGEVFFEGYVNDAETKLPISGASINAVTPVDHSNFLSDASGYYNTSGNIGIHINAPFRFNVTKALHSQYNVSFIPLFAKVIRINITLNSTLPSVTSINVGGVARDGDDPVDGFIDHGLGRPIENALVYVVNNTNYEVYTTNTSMTGWYLCPLGSTCNITVNRVYSLWGNKSGYYDSKEYKVIPS